MVKNSRFAVIGDNRARDVAAFAGDCGKEANILCLDLAITFQCTIKLRPKNKKVSTDGVHLLSYGIRKLFKEAFRVFIALKFVDYLAKKRDNELEPRQEPMEHPAFPSNSNDPTPEVRRSFLTQP